MNREILFRGKRVHNGEWVYGYWYPKFWMAGNGVEECHVIRLSDGSREIEVHPETVGQFTGLLDKNGNKIFEGDVCTFYNKYAQKTYTRVVRFCPLFACFGLYENMTTVYDYESDWVKISDIEIIGNTHDNPELINK